MTAATDALVGLVFNAAAAMRQRASSTESAADLWYDAQVIDTLTDSQVGGEDAEHMAAWSPSVALTVADWLDDVRDEMAKVIELILEDPDVADPVRAAELAYAEPLAVSRAFLRDPDPG